MLRSIRILLSYGALVLILPGLALAQKGTLAGKVIDAVSGDPLPGASVLVQGLDIGGATNSDGEYTIPNVPAGEHTVVARFIGYKSASKKVTVTGGSIIELNFQLSETVLQLDEIVVTGAGVASAKRKLGNTVSTINADRLADAPVATVSEMLSAREPGVNILPSGGLTGEGARIRIRGSASLSQTNEPVVYIDGIRVNAGAGMSIAGGGGVASRLDDINPDAIERIEILKGAAAATLYGTQASNGIIQIFTKKGQFSKPRFTLEIEQNMITYPKRIKPAVGFARTQEQADRMSSVFGFQVRPWELVTRDFANSLFSTGYGQTYSLSVSGGGTGVTYFISGRFNLTDGPFNPEPTDFATASNPAGLPVGGANDLNRRGQFSANVNVTPTDKLNFRISTGYTSTRQETPDNNNNIYATLTLAQFGKPEWVSENNPMGQVAFATVRETTFQENSEDTEHIFVSLASNYKLTKNITLDATAGLDYTRERAVAYRPFRWNVDGKTGAQTEGAINIWNFDQKEWTVDIKANWNKQFMKDFSSSFVAGFQGFITQTNSSAGFGQVFPGPGIETLSGTDNQTASSGFLEIINAGWFFQEQLGYKDYLYLTLGVRYDANSAFGSQFTTQAYPKVSVSFIPTSMTDRLADMGISTLRLRAAIGTSGQQPGAFDALTTFIPESSPIGPGLTPGNLGNPSLKPEVSTEYEVGFEAGILNDKLGFEFTYWDRTVSDALVLRQFPISGGFLRQQLDNIGELVASGMDISARFAAIKKENLSVDVFATAAYLQEEITDLGGAPPLKAGGSYPRYRNWVAEGYAPAAHLGAKLDRSVEYPIDLDGDNVPESREELLAFFSDPRNTTSFRPVLLDEDGDGDFLDNYLGKPTPDWSGNFGINVGFMKRFRLAAVFEYKAGDFYVNNLTDAFRKSHGLIGRNTPEAAARELVLLNPESTAEERLQAANEWVREFLALSPYSGLNTIEKADFVRWRELSIAFDVPRDFAKRFGLRNMTLSLAGRNIALFTSYSGTDPENNAIGRRSGGGTNNNFLTGVDAFGFPIPRQFVFSVKVGF